MSKTETKLDEKAKVETNTVLDVPAVAPSPKVEKRPATVRLTHNHPCVVQGASTHQQYRPDKKGVIEVAYKDALVLKGRFGWRDVSTT